MKTCKHFCDKYIKKMKKEGQKFRKEMKKMLKVTRKKLKNASDKEKPGILQSIEQINNSFEAIKKGEHLQDELYRNACNKGFCNPGCKGTIFESNPAYPLVNDFYSKTNEEYLRKEGAISGCSMSPFYL
jgi:hypothetical protein